MIFYLDHAKELGEEKLQFQGNLGMIPWVMPKNCEKLTLNCRTVNLGPQKPSKITSPNKVQK